MAISLSLKFVDTPVSKFSNNPNGSNSQAISVKNEISNLEFDSLFCCDDELFKEMGSSDREQHLDLNYIECFGGKK